MNDALRRLFGGEDNIPNQRSFFDDNGTIIVAISGGADSVALLDVLVSTGFKCVAAHCNYHLRGTESNRDEAHTRKICEQLGVPLVVKHFDVEAERERGESVEMVCRRLRYAWFRELREEYGCEYVAVAHNRDDNIETFFLNALRGCGIKGLAGMMKFNHDDVWRPLLDVSRAKILDYLNERGLEYVTDSSNLENNYKRNRIRNEVMPLLRELFPGCDETLSNTIAYSSQAVGFLTDKIVEIYLRVRVPGGGINIGELCQITNHFIFMLFHITGCGQLSMEQCKDICLNPDRVGKRFGNYILDRGILREFPTQKPKTVRFSNPDDSPFVVKLVEGNKVYNNFLGPDAIALDGSAFEGDPQFEVRPWRHGDRLAPYGMKGTRLVSDILSDAKVPIDRKESVMVLTRNEELLWVIGYRASRHFAVTADTKIQYYLFSNQQ